MSPQSPIIRLLPPPGPSSALLLLSNDDDAFASSPQGSQGIKISTAEAQLFLAALKVRFEVFVIEQHCTAANESDTDDARSWHWVIYAPPSSRRPPNDHPPRAARLESSYSSLVVGKAPEGPQGGGNNNNKYKNDIKNNKDEESGSVIPVATIRLVPFSPTTPPPTAAGGPPSGEVGGPAAEQPQQQPTTHTTATKMWNGKEPYIKLGRLATLRSHRGLGFGRVLIENALKWAVENASTLTSPVSARPQHSQPRVTGEKGEEEDEEEGNNGWNGLVLVHAQRRLAAWYKSVGGFVTDEGMGVWMEEGIEHVGMWRRLDLRGKREGEGEG